jgi:hypothetical protein
VRGLQSRAESAVAANIATPCSSNASSLLLCALANVHLGKEKEARRLERTVEDLGMEGYGGLFDPRYIEIAIARGDLAEVERKLSEWSPEGFLDIDGLVARLNALVRWATRARTTDRSSRRSRGSRRWASTGTRQRREISSRKDDGGSMRRCLLTGWRRLIRVTPTSLRRLRGVRRALAAAGLG